MYIYILLHRLRVVQVVYGPIRAQGCHVQQFNPHFWDATSWRSMENRLRQALWPFHMVHSEKKNTSHIRMQMLGNMVEREREIERQRDREKTEDNIVFVNMFIRWLNHVKSCEINSIPIW